MATAHKQYGRAGLDSKLVNKAKSKSLLSLGANILRIRGKVAQQMTSDHISSSLRKRKLTVTVDRKADANDKCGETMLQLGQNIDGEDDFAGLEVVFWNVQTGDGLPVLVARSSNGYIIPWTLQDMTISLQKELEPRRTQTCHGISFPHIANDVV